MLRVVGGQPAADAGAEVAALRAVPLVPQPGHQLGEDRAGPVAAVAQPRRPVREAVAGYRRRHDVKRVLRPPPVGDRIRQRPDDLGELRERPRPAVGQDQRKGVRLRRPAVHEVDVEAVDAGLELLELVEPALLRPPVELVAPVLDELPQVGLVHPEPPSDSLRLIRQARPRQALAQVRQHFVRNVDGERFDLRRGPLARRRVERFGAARRERPGGEQPHPQSQHERHRCRDDRPGHGHAPAMSRDAGCTDGMDAVLPPTRHVSRAGAPAERRARLRLLTAPGSIRQAASRCTQRSRQHDVPAEEGGLTRRGSLT